MKTLLLPLLIFFFGYASDYPIQETHVNTLTDVDEFNNCFDMNITLIHCRNNQCKYWVTATLKPGSPQNGNLKIYSGDKIWVGNSTYVSAKIFFDCTEEPNFNNPTTSIDRIDCSNNVCFDGCIVTVPPC